MANVVGKFNASSLSLSLSLSGSIKSPVLLRIASQHLSIFYPAIYSIF